jgi:hypothetical protein
MNFENLGQPETLNETGLGGMEVIGMTTLANFEASGITTTEGMANYLRENIPMTHLDHCAGICYEDRDSPEFGGAMGSYHPGTREIDVWKPAGEGGYEKVKDTVTHEIGHNVHHNMMNERPDLAERWNALYAKSLQQNQLDGRGYVSNYAATDPKEDFAETYKSFIRDPERLQYMNAEKYAFMHDEVFYGREYQAQSLAYWDKDYYGNKVEVTNTGVWDIHGNKVANSWHYVDPDLTGQPRQPGTMY